MGFKLNPFTGKLDAVDSPNGVFEALDVNGDIVLDDGGTYTTTLQTITATANRTISLPDATGTVALVAGSSGQLVYNNAGAQAGAPGSVVGATGNITLSLNGAASVPPFAVTGTWFAGTTPQVQIQPSNVGTVGAWSASGTGIGVNATSTFAGNLLDLQVNGTRRLSAPSTGDQALTFKAGAAVGNLYTDTSSVAMWTGASFSQTAVYLVSNTSCGFRVNGSDRFIIKNLGSVRVTTGLTVATLPASPEVGDIARVTDALAPAVGVTVVGGGAAAALCWYNGANWSVIGV